MRRPLRALLVASVAAVVAAHAHSAVAFNPDTRVSVGSPPSPFSANKQNEPAVAIDANHPSVLAAGANDNIDMEACNAGQRSQRSSPRGSTKTAGEGAFGVGQDNGRTIHALPRRRQPGLELRLRHGCLAARKRG